MTTTTMPAPTNSLPRHVLNALNKQGIKVADLTSEQRVRADRANIDKAGLRGKALATWILDGLDSGAQIKQARAQAPSPKATKAAGPPKTPAPAREPAPSAPAATPHTATSTTYAVNGDGSLGEPLPVPPSARLTGPQIIHDLLWAVQRPVHVAVIAERVLATEQGRARYAGKTPAQTISAQLQTSHKKGGEFVKVAPGCFGLRAWQQNVLDLEPIRPTPAKETTAA